ncbi:MAG: purine-binding chemotaxis protein CheW [Desulfarculus sp.]|nr:purine-binding chemotaxis protein CheW [Desulfarculus sp.]
MASKSAPKEHYAQARGESREGKYLTFHLGREEYGIGILKVREIIGLMPFTPIPRTPEFIKGVINLRGKVIPVVDLRLKFGMEPEAYSERTCIVVVQIATSQGQTSMGMVVDAVNEVANIKAKELELTPSFGVSLDSRYIVGMAKSGEQVRILLDIDRVLGEEEVALLGQAAGQQRAEASQDLMAAF